MNQAHSGISLMDDYHLNDPLIDQAFRDLVKKTMKTYARNTARTIEVQGGWVGGTSTKRQTTTSSHFQVVAASTKLVGWENCIVSDVPYLSIAAVT